jgi:hypothetical protein
MRKILGNPSEKILYEVVTCPLISLKQVPKRAEPLPGLTSYNSRHVSCLSTLPVSLLTIPLLAVVEFSYSTLATASFQNRKVWRKETTRALKQAKEVFGMHCCFDVDLAGHSKELPLNLGVYENTYNFPCKPPCT